MSPFGCRLAAVVAQPGIGTASRAAAVVPQYGHFLNGHWPVPGCSQLPLYMQQHGHRTAPLQTARFLKAVPRKKLSDIVNFLKSLEFCRNIMYHMMQLKMRGF
jgi:hypothetical protein